MDVSRVEAYNPNKILWQMLTAKEILKYEEQGVDVPDIYLQWAQNFINSVNWYKNDEVTYEVAQINELNTNTTETSTTPVSNSVSNENSNNTENSTSTTGSTDTTSNTELSAEEKRQQLEASGSSLVSIGMEFSQISSDKKEESSSAVSSSQSIQSSSQADVSTMDASVQDLFSMVDDTEAKIQDLKSRKNEDNVSQIMRLQNLIRSYGTNIQNQLSIYSSTFDGYNTELSGFDFVSTSSIDYGAQTLTLGDEIKRLSTPYNGYFAIGNEISTSGNGAITEGNNLVSANNIAQDINDLSIRTTNSYKNETLAKTGVAPIVQNNDDKLVQNPDDSNTITGEKKEEDKTLKTSNNDGSDDTDKLNIDLNEILKRKVRLGLQNQKA